MTGVIQSDHINLKWNHNEELEEEECYQIVMKQLPFDKWKTIQTAKPINCRTLTVDCLREETSYVFKVGVVNHKTGLEGPFSSESDVITTGESQVLKMMKMSEKIENGMPAIFKLPIQEVKLARNDRFQTRKFTLGILLFVCYLQHCS